MSPRKRTFRGFVGTLKILFKEDKAVRTLVFATVIAAISIAINTCTQTLQ